MSQAFAIELARYGPARHYAPVGRVEAQSYCSRLARTHYENFSVASVLLPRRLVRHFHNVYAYCRWADDLADEAGGGKHALELLRWWRGELLRCYAGEACHPVMVALQDTIARFRIPRGPFLDLLFAFEQDQLVKRYQGYEQLLGYCKHSANPVGRLVLYLFETHDEAKGAWSDQICTALQLTNFWQDVARDLDIGRVYLPVEDLRAFGYGEEDLHARRFTPEFRELMCFEVERARDLFYRGMPLLDELPEEYRPTLELFVTGGLRILRKIESIGYNVWLRRPVLSKWEKVALIGTAAWNRVRTLRPWP
ncbi:MAG: squalene synthase HpnC [Gemmataceae bacterium]